MKRHTNNSDVTVEACDKTNEVQPDGVTSESLAEETTAKKEEPECSNTVQVVPEAASEENKEPSSNETDAEKESKVNSGVEKPTLNEAVPTEASSDAVENSTEKYEDLD